MKKSTLGHSKSRPLAGVDEYRRPLFSVARCNVAEGAAPAKAGTDSWGWVRVVQGGVTQHHRDLLDTIRALAEHRVIDGGGQEHLIFDDAAVRAELETRGAWKDVKRSLFDMMSTIIQIDGPRGSWGAAFPLATFVGDANSPAARAAHQYPARLRRLVLSAGFTGMMERQASVSFTRSVLRRVLALRHAVSRAVARWCLSHSNAQHHSLAAVLAAVGAVAEGEPISGRGARSAARRFVQLLEEDADALQPLGIFIEDGVLHYHRQPGVFIEAGSQEIEAVPTNTQVVPTNTQAVPTNTQVSKEIS